MLTMCSVNENGFGKKRREWNKRQAIARHRQVWEAYANRALERAGFEERIDHRSLKEQGVEREPQIQLGAEALEMEARGVQTQVGDESRQISEVNRGIERQEAWRKKLEVEIAAEQVQTETYLWPDLTFSDEMESNLKQAVYSPAVELFSMPTDLPSSESSVPAADPDFVRRVGELLVRRRDEIALENSPAAAELAAEIERVTAAMNVVSAKTGGVFEKMTELLAKSDKAQHLADEKQRRVQLEKGRSPASSDEKMQGSVQRQEPLKQRQTRRTKKLDQGMEL